jgi:hypothetical protein
VQSPVNDLEKISKTFIFTGNDHNFLSANRRLSGYFSNVKKLYKSF